MSKTVKSSSKNTEPIVAKSVKAKPATKQAVAPTPVAAPTPVVVTEAETPAATDEVVVVDPMVELSAHSTVFISKMQSMSTCINTMKTEFKALQKKYEREIKAAQKSGAKKKRKSGNRAPSGFVKPTKISDELAKFLSKPVGTEMARTDVTKQINLYIREHKLQDPTNGRKIVPNKELTTLLRLTPEDSLTYFNLQRYMCPHYAKSEKAIAAAAAAAATA